MSVIVFGNSGPVGVVGRKRGVDEIKKKTGCKSKRKGTGDTENQPEKKKVKKKVSQIEKRSALERVPNKYDGFVNLCLEEHSVKYAAELACVKKKHRLQKCGDCVGCCTEICTECVTCINKESSGNSLRQKCQFQKCSKGYVSGCDSCRRKKN